MLNFYPRSSGVISSADTSFVSYRYEFCPHGHARHVKVSECHSNQALLYNEKIDLYAYVTRIFLSSQRKQAIDTQICYRL